MKAAQEDGQVLTRDHDYVTMADYTRDMAESTDQAVGIISQQRNDLVQLTNLLALAVKAAGGRIIIPQPYMVRMGQYKLRRYADDANHTLVLEITDAD